MKYLNPYYLATQGLTIYLGFFSALFRGLNAFHISSSQGSSLRAGLPTDLSSPLPMNLSSISQYVDNSNQLSSHYLHEVKRGKHRARKSKHRIKKETDQDCVDRDNTWDISGIVESGMYNIINNIEELIKLDHLSTLQLLIRCAQKSRLLNFSEKYQICNFTLWVATMHSNLDVAKVPIDECGANINSEYALGRLKYPENDIRGMVVDTILGIAIMNEDTVKNRALIRWLIDNGANVDIADILVVATLLRAAQYWRPEVVGWLRDRGANINVRDYNGETALMYAVSSICHAKGEGKSESLEKVTKYLIDNGADVNAVDKLGKTALMYVLDAAKNCLYINQRVVELLRDDKSDKSEIARTCNFVLFKAIVDNNLDAVKLVTNNCGNINAIDHHGNTALMLAVAAKNTAENTAVIRWLISNGADVNAVNDRGETALLNAAQWWRPVVVKWLKDKGANINAADHNGNTALIHAVCDIKGEGGRENLEMVKLVELVKYLTNHGADVNAVNDCRKTALWYAENTCLLYTREEGRKIIEFLRYPAVTIPDDMLQIIVVPEEEEVKLLRAEDTVGTPQISLTDITTTPTRVFSKLNDRS